MRSGEGLVHLQREQGPQMEELQGEQNSTHM